MDGKLWRELSKRFDISPTCTSASYLLRVAYEKTFSEWEQRREGLLLAAAAGDRLAAAATGYRGATGIPPTPPVPNLHPRTENQVQMVSVMALKCLVNEMHTD